MGLTITSLKIFYFQKVGVGTIVTHFVGSVVTVVLFTSQMPRKRIRTTSRGQIDIADFQHAFEDVKAGASLRRDQRSVWAQLCVFTAIHTETRRSERILKGLQTRNLVDKYKELFGNNLGCYNCAEASLQLKEGAKSKTCKARPLPFAIKHKVEAELGRLVEVEILEQVNHMDYATTIMPVIKSSGSNNVGTKS